MTASAFDALDRPPHLLLVDDDDRIRTLLKRYLSQAGRGCRPRQMRRGARKLLAAMDFDLLILDVMMPVEDGFRWPKPCANLQGADPAANGARHAGGSHPRPLDRRR